MFSTTKVQFLTSKWSKIESYLNGLPSGQGLNDKLLSIGSLDDLMALRCLQHLNVSKDVTIIRESCLIVDQRLIGRT